MTDFQYNINQEVLIDNKDPNLVGRKVKVVARFPGKWRDHGVVSNAYKVWLSNTLEPIELYEDQLKEIDSE